MRKPKLRMFDLTEEEIRIIYKHLRAVNPDCPMNKVSTNSQWRAKDSHDHRFCETLFVGFNATRYTCPCCHYGRSFGTDALITLLDYNRFEFPQEFDEDCNPINERSLPYAVRKFV